MANRDEEMHRAIQDVEFEEDDESTEYVRPRAPKEPAQVYSVRIPVDRIEQLRRVAAAKSQPPSALLREWVLERLDQEVAVSRAGVSRFTITAVRSGAHERCEAEPIHEVLASLGTSARSYG